MKKKNVLMLFLCLGTLTMSLSLFNDDIVNVHAALEKTGELNQGVKAVFDSSLEDVTKYLSVNLTDTSNSGSNFFARLKNNTNSEENITFVIETNNGHFSTIKSSGHYILYDESGDNAQSLTSIEGGFFTVPASFNGYLSVTNLNLSDAIGWTQIVETKNISIINSLYFGIQTQENTASISVGDVFTSSAYNLDVSSLNETAFLAAFQVKDDVSGVTLSRLPATDFDPNHDMNGGALVTVQQLDSDTPVYWQFYPQDVNFQGDGLFMRLKNGWSYDYWMQFYILGSNNHRLSLGNNLPTYTYDLNAANKTQVLSRSFGSYFYIKGNFDGYVYIPFTTMIDDSTWSGNSLNPTMDYSSVYCLTFGLSGYYDYASQTMFGDIFTTETTIFDGSSYSENQLSQHLAPDAAGNGQYANISRLAGYVQETTYNYADVTGYHDTDITGGVIFSVIETDENNTSSFVINGPFNMTGANAITMRIKNYSYDYPYYLKVKDSNGRVVSPQGQILGNIYYLSSQGTLTVNEWGGNDVYVKIPTSFDGLMIIPLTSLGGGESLEMSNISSLEFFVSTKYDFGFKVTFGDIGFIDDDLVYHSSLDASSLSSEQWALTYVLNQNASNGVISRLEAKALCSWIGDVKILNSMVYASDDEMATEVVTDNNDNPLTYERMSNGIKVTPSNYEVGHINGPYSCLALINNSNFDDRQVMTDETFGEAKGLTLYVKSLASREIGVSLGFDQATINGGVQRWSLIGYPSMYYSYDVNKDAEYINYCKRDQFQIPAGFEGYIRIPFSSYGIPDWCTTNEALALNRFTGNLYLAQDNREYSQLSYLVKNVGVYFKDTACGSLFNSTNTIKTNMGL